MDKPEVGSTFGGPIRNPEAMLATTVADGFTIASVGDIVCSRPIANRPETAPVAALVQAADVATGNCEGVLYDVRSNRLAIHTPSLLWPIAMHPSVAADLKAIGFDMLSRANNQVMGYGDEGMRETSRSLEAAGLEHAGIGETLAHARAARFFETPRGRIGMVSFASTFDDWNRAADPTPEMPGHAGLSGLRLTRFVAVSAEEMKALRGILAARPGAAGNKLFMAPPVLEPDELMLFGVRYKERDPATGDHYIMNPGDRAQIIRAIRTGKANSDFLVATIHAHEQVPDTSDFLIELAHEAIDNGADCFVGHGPHVVRGIEIYRGRPIFYSLGDFAFDIHVAGQPISADIAEQRGVDLAEVSGPEFTARGWDAIAVPALYEAVIAVSRYEGNRLSEVRLHPIELGWERRPADRGYPRLASPERGQAILEDLQRRSRRFNTEIAIEDGVGVIRADERPE